MGLKVPYVLQKAVKKAAGTTKKKKTTAGGVPDFSKKNPSSSKDPKYKPAVNTALSEPPKEGEVVEFKHPTHGKKTRGRVTAVGQDGYKARISDGTALDVPHTHHVASLPVGDFGTESQVSPQDAKDAFLGPTKEGGIPATSLQIALLDVMAQYGFPIDEDTITTINYDQARRLLSQYVLEDDSGYDAPQKPLEGSESKNGPGPTDGTSAAPGASSGPTEGQGTAGQEDPMRNPEVKEAVDTLIGVLETMSEAPGTPEPSGKKPAPAAAKKKPAARGKTVPAVVPNKKKPVAGGQKK